MTESHRGREGFGNRLRALRLDAGLTGKELADQLGWAASKVSRLEHGRQTASADDVAAWVMACGAGPDVQDDLLADLRSLRVQYAAWRRQLRTGFAGRQRVAIALEAATSMLRVYEPAIVPGLSQTPDYARHVFINNAAFRDGASDIDAAVQARMKRQEFLYDRGKRFRFLVTEAALLYLVCPPATLRAQLDRLVVLSGLDTVELAVLPFDLRQSWEDATMIAGLLLAAGAGRRYGMPKALVDGGAWLRRAVATLTEGGCDPVLVVIGAEADRVAPLVPDTAGTVLATDWAEGMGASLRTGLAELIRSAPPQVQAALVHLVDLPDVDASVVRRLVALAGPAVVARAGFESQPGHPVLFGRQHWADIVASARGDRGARDWLAQRSDLAVVDCSDLASGIDVDRP